MQEREVFNEDMYAYAWASEHMHPRLPSPIRERLVAIAFEDILPRPDHLKPLFYILANMFVTVKGPESPPHLNALRYCVLDELAKIPGIGSVWSKEVSSVILGDCLYRGKDPTNFVVNDLGRHLLARNRTNIYSVGPAKFDLSKIRTVREWWIENLEDG